VEGGRPEEVRPYKKMCQMPNRTSLTFPWASFIEGYVAMVGPATVDGFGGVAGENSHGEGTEGERAAGHDSSVSGEGVGLLHHCEWRGGCRPRMFGGSGLPHDALESHVEMGCIFSHLVAARPSLSVSRSFSTLPDTYDNQAVGKYTVTKYLLAHILAMWMLVLVVIG
jgi:hypothetical protein